MACLHREIDQRSGHGHPMRTPNPHRAAVGSGRSLRCQIQCRNAADRRPWV